MIEIIVIQNYNLRLTACIQTSTIGISTAELTNNIDINVYSQKMFDSIFFVIGSEWN